MAWLQACACLAAFCLLAAPVRANLCPDSCACVTTRDGLHRATCSSLPELYKFTLRQKHHNINILDLSHNNITKISHELDRLTEVVTLDLSTNGITNINKFLNNAKKLVHLSLANNRIRELTMTYVPASVSSLDLTNNLLQDVPSDLKHLVSLEHLQLEGNPLDCSCPNIRARDQLVAANVYIDKVLCASPLRYKGFSWLELKTKDVCKVTKSVTNYLDMMMGDQPVDAERIGEETTALKSMSLVEDNELGEANVLNTTPAEDDDSKQFMKVSKTEKPVTLTSGDVEGSGDFESTTAAEFIESTQEPTESIKMDDITNAEFIETTQVPMLSKESMKMDEITIAEFIETTQEPIVPTESIKIDDTTIAEFIETTPEPKLPTELLKMDDILPADDLNSTDDPIETVEGSGEGSGDIVLFNNETEGTEETTPPVIVDIGELNPDPIHKFFEDENSSSTEFPPAIKPGIFLGGADWHSQTEPPSTERAATPFVIHDTTVSQKLETPLTKTGATTEEKPPPHKTGTYVCIAIIVVLLVGLIGFAIIKGQMRKRRDHRLQRQQKRDVEKASKEMVDMNKSLLGKPALIDAPMEKKINGKYELVPTHESHQRKSENGDVGNGIQHTDTNGVRTNSPRDTNQNKNSSKDNNITDELTTPIQDTSFDSALSNESRKDTHSTLSSEDIFVPMNDEDTPKLNGNLDLDISQPLINGDQNTDSDYLSPSREYVPVYSPDMGRVRIKMSETPKPKTPVLVTRSRSNAGDIIITPSVDGYSGKTTT